MKYIFSNQVIDFTMLFLMIWNVWVFIFNKSQKEDMKMAVKNLIRNLQMKSLNFKLE